MSTSHDGIPQQGAKVESQEREIQTFTFVYRGDNPFLEKLVAQVRTMGHTVTVYKVPIETPDETLRDAQKLKPLLGEFSGKVVTDTTLHKAVSAIAGEEVFNAYKLMEWDIQSVEDLAAKYQPLVEEVRSAGKTPIVLEHHIGDHSDHIFGKQVSKLAKELGKPNIRSSGELSIAIFEDRLGVAKVSEKDFTIDYRHGRTNLIDALNKMGVQPKDAVVLVDHHVSYLREKEIVRAGFDQVQFVPICSCCIGETGEYKSGLGELNLFPLKYKAATVAYAQKLTGEEPERVEPLPIPLPSVAPAKKVTVEAPQISYEGLSFAEIVKQEQSRILDSKNERWKRQTEYRMPDIFQDSMESENGEVVVFTIREQIDWYRASDDSQMRYEVYVLRKGETKAKLVVEKHGYESQGDPMLWVEKVGDTEIVIQEQKGDQDVSKKYSV
jgi:hypothetical protein